MCWRRVTDWSLILNASQPIKMQVVYKYINYLVTTVIKLWLTNVHDKATFIYRTLHPSYYWLSPLLSERYSYSRDRRLCKQIYILNINKTLLLQWIHWTSTYFLSIWFRLHTCNRHRNHNACSATTYSCCGAWMN